MHVEFHYVPLNSMGRNFKKSRSAVRMPFFKGNDNLAKHFTITTVFKDESSDSENQTLVSTCSSDGNSNKPTFAIIVDTIDRKLVFHANPKSEYNITNIEFSLTYDVSFAIFYYNLEIILF